METALLEEIVRRLVEAYDPERVYLFGSSARGDSGPEGDLDLMVIVRDDAPEPRRRSRLAYQVLRGTSVGSHVVVCTREYFESRTGVRASLAATVLREGKLLHSA